MHILIIIIAGIPTKGFTESRCRTVRCSSALTDRRFRTVHFNIILGKGARLRAFGSRCEQVHRSLSFIASRQPPKPTMVVGVGDEPSWVCVCGQGHALIRSRIPPKTIDRTMSWHKKSCGKLMETALALSSRSSCSAERLTSRLRILSLT